MKPHRLLFSTFLLLLLASSCKTLEQRCEERFPQEVQEVVRETHRTDTIIVPWHSVEFVDTTVCPPSADTNYVIKRITKQLPGDTIYHEVMCIDTVMVFSDQPKVNYLTAELQHTRTTLAQAQGKYKTGIWVIAFLGLLSIALAVLLIRRK
jgi:hypothetical protein